MATECNGRGSDGGSMTLILKQVRDCDGVCCQESPRWPNEDKTDCIFRDPTKPDRGCKIMAGLAEVPEGQSPVLHHLSGEEAYQLTCANWPENTYKSIGKTGGCCWQWMEDGT